MFASPSATIFIAKPSTNLTIQEEERVLMIDCIDESTEIQNEETRSNTIKLGKNAHLTFLRFQNKNQLGAIEDHKEFILDEGSKLDFMSVSFGAGSEKLTVKSAITNKYAVSNLTILYYASKRQHFAYTISNDFKESDASGVIKIKGIGDEESQTRVDGIIRIAKEAHRTNSHLEEHTLLLSKAAKIENIPSLEICTNDVKASHAASMSQIDKEQLFYCASRGIPYDRARALIIQGFFLDVISGIEDATIKEKILAELRTRHQPRSGF